MRRAMEIKGPVKDYLWGDGLDFWNTPSHKVHDFPLTNPLQDFIIWNQGGKGSTALGKHHLEKLRSGDYNDMLMKPFGGRPTTYKPICKSKNYKSSSSSLSSYQQNGGGGGTKGPSGAVAPSAKFTGVIAYKRRGKPTMRCPEGYGLKKIKGRWMCVPNHNRK